MCAGVSITEMAVSELPGRPTAVWTVKKSQVGSLYIYRCIYEYYVFIYVCMYVQGDDFDRYIIVSFNNATLVLSIGETVEEVTDSGFLTTSPTLQVYAYIHTFTHPLKYTYIHTYIHTYLVHILAKITIHLK